MNTSLINALLNKNALTIDTVVTAKYQTTDMFGRLFSRSGEFKIKNILFDTTGPLFELQLGNEVKQVIKTDGGNIDAIEGMDPARYADIYDILPDGTSKKVGRKRGRKPKAQLTM